jgi:hypothetical protein
MKDMMEVVSYDKDKTEQYYTYESTDRGIIDHISTTILELSAADTRTALRG